MFQESVSVEELLTTVMFHSELNVSFSDLTTCIVFIFILKKINRDENQLSSIINIVTFGGI